MPLDIDRAAAAVQEKDRNLNFKIAQTSFHKRVKNNIFINFLNNKNLSFYLIGWSVNFSFPWLILWLWQVSGLLYKTSLRENAY